VTRRSAIAAAVAGAIVAGVVIGGGLRLARSHRSTSLRGPAAIPTPTALGSAPFAVPSPDASDSSPLAPTSPGCGRPPPARRDTSYATRSGRTFHVWMPEGYDPTRAHPVVLVFHGWYTNGRDFESWFKMEDHDQGAFTVYPDSDGAMWDLTGNRDLDFVADILEAMSNAYCIDRAHVFALGFSYGGKFVHHLGCKRPALVRAISVGDGSWAHETGCAPIPVLVTHRTRDHDELIAWGKGAAERWAKIDGCSEATRPTDTEHGCVAYGGCSAPGSVTFCEDTHFDPTWPKEWNHTIREEYRSLTWTWFRSVP
jgi:poly(3-hydroxybutyrate) depolymerase